MSQKQFFGPQGQQPGNASFTLEPGAAVHARAGQRRRHADERRRVVPADPAASRSSTATARRSTTASSRASRPSSEGAGEHPGHRHGKDDTAGTAAGAARAVRLEPADARQDRHDPGEQVGRLRRRDPAARRRGPGLQRRPQARGHLRQHAPAEPYLCGQNGNIFGGKAPGPDLVRRDDPDPRRARRSGPLPPTDPRYVDGGPESAGARRGRLQRAGRHATACSMPATRSRSDEINRSDPKGTVVSQSPRGARAARRADHDPGEHRLRAAAADLRAAAVAEPTAAERRRRSRRRRWPGGGGRAGGPGGGGRPRRAARPGREPGLALVSPGSSCRQPWSLALTDGGHPATLGAAGDLRVRGLHDLAHLPLAGRVAELLGDLGDRLGDQRRPARRRRAASAGSRSAPRPRPARPAPARRGPRPRTPRRPPCASSPRG